jgi:hypothetical protein
MIQHGFRDGFAITPSDTVVFTKPCEAIYVGGAGAVVVLTPGGTTLTFAAVPVGTVLYVKANRVNSTNTTATNLVALFGA